MKRILIVFRASLYISMEIIARTREASTRAIVNQLSTTMKNADLNELIACSFKAGRKLS